MALSSALPADASTAVRYGYLNLCRTRYTAGLKIDGVSIDWSARKTRAVSFLVNDVRASIYALTECDDFMAGDLIKSFGSNWTGVGFASGAHNAGGWLWDKRKWSLTGFTAYGLPGVQNRKLLTVKALHRLSGVTLALALTHLASGAPADRDAQMAVVLSLLNGHVLVGDINASSPATGDCSSTAPRTQLACAGYSGPDFGATFNNWTPASTLALDYAGVTGSKVRMSGFKFATYPKRVSDHDCLRLGLSF